MRQSAAKHLRQQILTEYPSLTPYIDTILPKRSPLVQVKARNSEALIYTVDGEPLFFHEHGQPLVPHLRILHQCEVYSDPFMLKPIVTDLGAVSHIIGGANLMRPGVRMENLAGYQAGEIVQIVTASKFSAFAVGRLLMNDYD
jgi:PUA domain protein